MNKYYIVIISNIVTGTRSTATLYAHEMKVAKSGALVFKVDNRTIKAFGVGQWIESGLEVKGVADDS